MIRTNILTDKVYSRLKITIIVSKILRSVGTGIAILMIIMS